MKINKFSFACTFKMELIKVLLILKYHSKNYKCLTKTFV